MSRTLTDIGIMLYVLSPKGLWHFVPARLGSLEVGMGRMDALLSVTSVSCRTLVPMGSAW